MGWIILAAVIIVMAAIVLLKFSQMRATGPVDYPYRKEAALFSPAERSFYGVLSQAVEENARIFAKVRVADVIVPKKTLSRSDRQKAFNRISAKHFDFLLCGMDDLSILCAIELDDRSHLSKKRQQRDEFLKGVCDAAGVPLIQLPAKAGYVTGEVKQLITPYLNLQESQIQDETDIPEASVNAEKPCPKCSSPMVIRVARNGNNACNRFRACSTYPKCRYVEAIRE